MLLKTELIINKQMGDILSSKWFLVSVIVIVVLFIGSQTNWFGIKKPSAEDKGKRLADAYANLTPEQRLELEQFRTELFKA